MANLISNILKNVGGAAKGLYSGVSQRKIGAAGILLGGMGGSLYLSEYAKRQKNYLGEDRFNARYGTTIDTASNLAFYGGIFGSIARLAGADVFGVAGRAVNTGRNTLAMRSFRKATAAGKTVAKPTLRRGLSFLDVVGTTVMGSNLALMGWAGTHVEGAAMLGAGLVGLGVFATSARTFGLPGPLATTAAGVGMGYIASRQQQYAAGEGNIIDFRVNDQNTVRKMDFNTAGLVQALHTNRKVM